MVAELVPLGHALHQIVSLLFLTPFPHFFVLTLPHLPTLLYRRPSPLQTWHLFIKLNDMCLNRPTPNSPFNVTLRLQFLHLFLTILFRHPLPFLILNPKRRCQNNRNLTFTLQTYVNILVFELLVGICYNHFAGLTVAGSIIREFIWFRV